MPFLKGEDINIGIAKETVRGTYVTPSAYIPARTPTGIKVAVDKAPIRETTGGGMGSTGSIVVQKRAEGDLEFNLRSRTIGFLLLSLLGKATSSVVVASTVYSHLFEILLGNPQFPSLSLALSQLGFQDYKYAKSLVKSLEISTPVNDLVTAKASFLSSNEETVADVTVAFSSTDHYFRPFDVVIKVAADVAGLAAAPALALKEFSLSIDNNARVNQNIGELTPSDLLALMHEINGSFVMDYTAETYRDAYVAGTYYAMSMTLTRTDIDLGSGNSPSLSIVMPKISFESREADRPIDDIVTDNVEFIAHHDIVTGYGIRATLVNDQASY